MKKIDFADLSTKCPEIADGHIGVYKHGEGLLVAVATISHEVRARGLSSLYKGLKDHGFIERNNSYQIIHESQPAGAPYFLTFMAPEAQFEKELRLLIDYFRQTRVMKDAIVSDMTWLETLNNR